MSSTPIGPCLDDRAISALIGGRLSASERDEATNHLDLCDLCRELIAEAALAKPTVDAKGRSTERLGAEEDRPSNVDPETFAGEGRYRDREEIARGGMGRVLEATDTFLGRRVAVKEVLSTSPEALRRFAREIRITARLEHPSIVPVYDAGTAANGAPFYVMRRVSGQPLEELVGEATTLAQRLALLPHLAAAANAVAHAHRRGVIHRDIKPTNILVGDLGETVVIDWGLAKVLDDPDDDIASAAEAMDAGDSLRTRVGTVFGTPGFMSPEQVAGETIDERADVYALGATLYYMLARRPPHARSSGTEMMSAAVIGPPQPLRELVAGVPPELSTIVDKALAHDDRARYRNAGAMVEDLQRFLTGQLVASHRYSRRERLVRFVRAHRVAVGSIGATIVAISIVAAISISRDLAARDRIDAALQVALTEKRAAEEARTRATERADELTLAQARILVDTDPTAAVALIKPLAASENRWRQVRDIGAAARSAGAAWGLVAPLIVTSLEISPSGTSALVCGEDGTVRIYDLVAKTSRELANAGKHARATFADDAHIITSLEDRITSIDIAKGTSRTLVWTTSVDAVVATATSVLWLDREGALWRTDAALATPHRISLSGRGKRLLLAPDGRWLAVSGTDHLYLVDLATESVHELGNGYVSDVAWDPSSRNLVALIGGVVHDVRLDLGPIVTQTFATRFPMGVASFADRLFYFGSSPLQITERTRRETTMRKIGASFLPLLVARNDVLISADNTSGIQLLSDERDLVLRPPIRGLNKFATSPHGNYVVATGEGRLLIWNLEVLLPRRIAVPFMLGFQLVGSGQVIVKALGEPWVWMDLRTGTSTTIEANLNPMAPIIGGPDPDRVLVIEQGKAAVLQRTPSAAFMIEGISHALLIPDRKLLLVTPAGDILSSDLEGKHRELLGSHATAPVFARWVGSWVVVQFADGFVWRRNLVTRETSTLSLGASVVVPSPRRLDVEEIPMQVATDGRVFAVRGDEVLLWNLDGRLVHHAKLPKNVLNLFGIGDDLALAITEDRAAYRFDFAHVDALTSILGAGFASQIEASSDSQLGLVPGALDGVDVIDLATGIRWPLGTTVQAQTAAITGDGAHVVQMLKNETLGVWNLRLPTKREDVAGWLDGITNATADLGPSSVTWAD